MSDPINVKGLSELQKFLDQLTPKMEANVIRAALRQGANVVLAEARNNAPKKTGLLALGLKVGTTVKKGVAIASLKVKGKHDFIARWVEYGTAAHEIKPKKSKSLFFAGLAREIVQHPGARPKPFLRPALDTRAAEATVAVGNAIKARLEKKYGLDTAAVEIEA